MVNNEVFFYLSFSKYYNRKCRLGIFFMRFPTRKKKQINFSISLRLMMPFGVWCERLQCHFSTIPPFPNFTHTK